MKHRWTGFLDSARSLRAHVASVVAISLLLTLPLSAADKTWPAFRSHGDSHSAAENIPTTVLKLGDKPELVANNEIDIDGAIVYGVAFVDGHILIRTGTELICVK